MPSATMRQPSKSKETRREETERENRKKVGYLYGGKPMASTVATSRSAGLSTMPSATTRQPSLTTGKKINSTMSCGLKGGGLPPLYRPASCKESAGCQLAITFV